MANSGISSKQKCAIRALLTGGSYPDAARAAQVHENTIGQWMKDDRFLEALRAAESAAMSAVSRSLVSIADSAADVLKDVLSDPDARDSSKIRAADTVLGRLIQIKEMAELEDRIRRLEEMQNEKEL
jgi:hypothetical protein